MKQIFALIMMMACCYACSSSTTEVTEDTAQQVYNDFKGTYQGAVMVDNIPQAVIITIGNDFQVSRLPVKPILKRIFTDETQLTQALATTSVVNFTAKTETISFATTEAYLFMEPTDLQFSVTVDGTERHIDALMDAQVYKSSSYNYITAYLLVKDLICDGTPYDSSKESITYYIDSAQKQTEEKQNNY